ncbi:MAG: hypothetical protein AAGI44_12960, partial [Pseudomonadota bacterium]
RVTGRITRSRYSPDLPCLFQADMSISLKTWAFIAAAAALAACQNNPPAENVVVEEAVAKPQQILPVQHWLRWQETVATMSDAQLITALETSAEPRNDNQSFYYGLLRQQTDSYQDWVKARDIFRTLRQKDKLSVGQRRLAELLERYNQSRINWYQSRRELRIEYESLEGQLVQLQEENRLLENKIEAITELEATIRTRKED